MIGFNVYTQQQVNDTLIRALQTMYVISKRIETGFIYYNPLLYASVKDLQYDIYTLYKTIAWKMQFIDFSEENDSFNQLIGSLINKIDQYGVWGDFGNNPINPHYQNGGNPTINVVRQAPFPIDYIPYSEFDPATEQPNGGRYIYYQPLWDGYRPVLSFVSPQETALRFGIDYALVPGGGIQLLLTGNYPYIFDDGDGGQAVRATSYIPI